MNTGRAGLAAWDRTVEEFRTRSLPARPVAARQWEGATLDFVADTWFVADEYRGRRYDELWTSVAVVNRGPAAFRIGFGGVGCVARISAYRTPDRTGPAAWVSERFVGGGCPAMLWTRDLAPGEAMSPSEFRVVLARESMAKLPPPPGRYHLVARLELLHGPNQSATDTVHVPAGSMELTADWLSGRRARRPI